MKTDIVKGIIYDRGVVEVNGQKKHKSLIAMVVLTDKPFEVKDHTEYVFMGSSNIYEGINSIPKYQPPYKLGQIGDAIIDISSMSPEELDEIKL
jgi:hypothetical protein